ncbi:serine hydrolase domain-containing protein [Arachidicoccus terrestris]|uniref:serine hydrolase domain-containing protein n=1 Tax=Arachidicoccus terrestris TaxID=2875539 RepID=UPI001CC6C9B0|nr:serine hydrolase [Arachidicoccus terrestris]UAY57207.1 beta-lactamase family protein [Arachidicoccus terrestris]
MIETLFSIKRALASMVLTALMAGGIKAQIRLDTSSFIRHNQSILSLVVYVSDSLAYAQSFNGHSNDDLFNNQSLTKNVMALLIGIAIDKGYIDSLDVPIANFFPELKKDPDGRKAKITLREIMNQASGLWHENLENLGQYLSLNNPSGYVLQQPLVAAPGTVLHYNNAASHLMSVILSKATGQSTLAFAKKYLFAPLQISRVKWPEMKDSYYDGCGLLSVHMSAADMNKIGRLILQRGKFNGKQIVSKRWTKSLLRPEKTYPAPWGLLNTTYGLTFYHKLYHNLPVTYGMGWAGQFLILIPDLQAVIAVNQVVDDRTAVRQSAFFMDRILPLIINQIVAQENNGDSFGLSSLNKRIDPAILSLR